VLFKNKIYNASTLDLPATSKIIINTINAHSYNIAKNDPLFCNALLSSDIIIPDGVSVVWAINWLTGKHITKIAGEDLFYYEMNRLQKMIGKALFLGSSENIQKKSRKEQNRNFPK
jgi:N-acetylglucosaminyldiphosphoundecaprenol N-acetyl-beta-D-mannosaminyltransferase